MINAIITMNVTALITVRLIINIVLELSSVDGGNNDVVTETCKTLVTYNCIEKYLPCDKIFIGILVGPFILTPLSFCTAILIVSVYVN